jgi:hypothetical protein
VPASPAGRLGWAAKLRLAAAIVAAYLRARRSLRRLGLLPTVAGLHPAGAASAAPIHEQRRTALALAHAVGRTFAPLPGDTRCLMRSLVLGALLARRGLQFTLVIGTRVQPEFAAHAWVEIDRRPVLPDGGGEYGRLLEL